MREAKRYAAEHDQTLTRLIEEALREKLLRRKEAAGGEPFTLKPFSRAGQGVQPGVDLDNNAALLDLMEDR
jgi:hypothetical protein